MLANECPQIEYSKNCLNSIVYDKSLCNNHLTKEDVVSSSCWDTQDFMQMKIRKRPCAFCKFIKKCVCVCVCMKIKIHELEYYAFLLEL